MHPGQAGQRRCHCLGVCGGAVPRQPCSSAKHSWHDYFRHSTICARRVQWLTGKHYRSSSAAAPPAQQHAVPTHPPTARMLACHASRGQGGAVLPDGALEPGEQEEAAISEEGQHCAHCKALHGLQDCQASCPCRQPRQRGVSLASTGAQRLPGVGQLGPGEGGQVQHADQQLRLHSLGAACRASCMPFARFEGWDSHGKDCHTATQGLHRRGRAGLPAPCWLNPQAGQHPAPTIHPPT